MLFIFENNTPVMTYRSLSIKTAAKFTNSKGFTLIKELHWHVALENLCVVYNYVEIHNYKGQVTIVVTHTQPNINISTFILTQ